MNTQTFSIATKRIMIGLVTVATLGVISLPLRADDAVIQESVQEAINTGEDNTSVQNSYQDSRIERKSRNRYNDNDTGVVQRSDQYCDQYGANNLCAQNTEQRSNIRHNHRR